jgi:sugar lactone lactonase YvrE
MLRILKVLSFVLMMTLALPMAAQDGSMELPAEIVVPLPGFMPEGIEWDADNGRFLLGSLMQGTIFQVADDGTITPLLENDGFDSTVGIQVDKANHRLLVANADPTVFFDPEAVGMAGLFAFDLESGEMLFSVDLTALDAPEGTRYFANDVAVDKDGSAYVTNSFAPVIYRVEPDGNASVFIEDERLATDTIGLNGIDYHPDGYLLVAVVGSGAIYKIPLENPDAMTQVELSEPLGIDGMILHPNGVLLAIAVTTGDAATQQAVAIQSEDDWATATVIDRLETGSAATTITVRDGVPYFINAYLSNPQAEQYEIVRVDFSKDVLAMEKEADVADDLNDYYDGY